MQAQKEKKHMLFELIAGAWEKRMVSNESRFETIRASHIFMFIAFYILRSTYTAEKWRANAELSDYFHVPYVCNKLRLLLHVFFSFPDIQKFSSVLFPSNSHFFFNFVFHSLLKSEILAYYLLIAGSSFCLVFANCQNKSWS